MDSIKGKVANTFLDIATYLETGQSSMRPRIGITGIGSELGEETVLKGAIDAAKNGIDVVFIGSLSSDKVECVHVFDEDECHSKMESMLTNKEIMAAVTMHYPFPIGVSTVGRLLAPGSGREIFIATTTGTSSLDRVAGMVKNAVYGVIAAKSCGIERPTVGILNVEGARAAEGALKTLQGNGYDIEFAESKRADGGCVLRGNDVLSGAADIIVTDPLTGNILTKMLSSFTTGGVNETVGYGYGPGIGMDYDRMVMIISRASGVPVISGAIRYAADLLRGNYFDVLKKETNAAKKAGIDSVCESRCKKAESEDISAPPTEVVTAQIAGVEIMDLEDAVKCLWSKGIYAQSGMGCTGPIILVSEVNLSKSQSILASEGWITQ